MPMVKSARESIEYALDIELVKLYFLVVLGLWTFFIADELFLAFGRIFSRILAVALQIPALLLTFAGFVGILRYCLADLDTSTPDSNSDMTN
jgi:hypothetical protein